MGWTSEMTSRQQSRLGRVFDILSTAWRARRDYDIAHIDVFSGAAFVWAEGAAALLRKSGVPYVATLRGGNLPAFASTNPRRVKRLLEGATRITVPSRYLLETISFVRPRADLIPNPIDIKRYGVRVRTSAQPKLVWLRAFHEIYDPSLAIEVVARIRSEFPGLHLGMFGPDKDGSADRIRRMIAERSLAGVVTVHGQVAKPDVPSALSAADIFLNTTTIDNTPVSVLEAMACGLCVVSTNVGGIPYLLTHEHDALLVPPGDAPAMAAAVRRILSEPGLAERLSRNARATAERHDWSHVLPRWEALFMDVAAEARAGHA